MFERPPNGFFVRDLILFNQLRRGGYVAKGFIFEAPDLTNSPIVDLNEFQEQLCLLLASLHENQRLQVQYFSDSDYKAELLRYQQETERFENVWTKRSRNERFARYWQAMVDRKLRRQRVVFYVSRSLDNVPKTLTSNTALREYYLALLDQLETEFTHVQHLLKEIFASAGTRVLPMNDVDHFRHYKTFLNPSFAERFDFDPAGDFQADLSIQENCWHSEGNGQSDFGFYMDGHYHSVIALTRWPRSTYPGIIQRLTNLRLLDFTITVNIDPLPITQEINKEEKEHDRVAGDYASEKKISLLTVMEKKQKKIHALMQGQTIPFKALFVIRVWDKSKEGLNAKSGAIKNAINSMNSAQYFESNLPSTSKNLFFETWPGWTWGRYEHRKLYAEHRYLADMLPVTSTFTGHLKTAEAIYDGPNNNLIGVETFSGSKDNQSPQHAVLLGMSGAGKSVSVCDLLSQTEGYFAYTVIIEEGLSYGIYTQTVEEGARPIIIHPDGDLTINYLDTKGLPLTPDHLSAATALVARMIGTSSQEDKQMLRQAQIAKYLNLLYEDSFQDWQKKRHDQLLGIARHALALQQFRAERMPPGATSLETFADYRLNTRFARFINVPELMQIFRQMADVQTAAMLNLPRPKLDGEKPAIRSAPATPPLKKFVQSLVERAHKLKTERVDPSEDNMLKITSEGRKAALDLRLMIPTAKDDPQSKVNLAVENIFRIWETTKDDRLAQLVFCDLSTPKEKGFSVYDDMEQKLVKLGVPPEEIAFIQDYDADNAKLMLFRSVRAGKTRILFGSTQKMGSGTNVQERLIALHHLDAPWRPADVEQREGRILRQGNKNAVVQIYRYVTEGSFDAYMWQTLETKAKFIAQVMSGDMTVRRLEDMDSAALTYAEVKAIASGNPLVIEKAQVDAELIRLTRLRSAHAEEQYRIRSGLRHSHEEVETWTERLANLREDLKLRQDTSGDLFRIELDKQVLDNRGIAGELLLRRAEKIKTRFGEDIRIGRFAGFDLFIRAGFSNSAELVLRGKNSYSTRVTDTALGTIRSLESVVQGFEERAGRLETDIKDSQKRGVELEAKVGALFEKEERYHHLVKRQSEIEDQLDLTKNQAPNQLETAENTEAIVEGEQPDKNETIKPKAARRMKV